MKKVFLISFLLIMSMSLLVGEIKFHGDGRVRPRLDQKFDENGKTSEDFYYFYWVRLWMDAELDDGWYFRTKLSTDGPADFVGKFGSPTFDGVRGWTADHAAHSGHRGIVRFNEVHFGRKTDKFGFSMGLLPFNALTNPEYDLHFYPVSKSDIPYYTLNNNAAAGFRGYYEVGPGRLNASLTVDNNTGNREVVDERDQYSAFLNYEVPIGNMEIQPTVIASLGAEGNPSPVTAGFNFTPPQLSGFNFQAGAYFTSQNASVENPVTNSGYLDLSNFAPEDSAAYTGKYNGPGVHVQLARQVGPGTVVGWIDYKTINIEDLSTTKNTTLMWLMYKYTVYKSDFGAFVLAPTYRQIRQKFGDHQYIRNKIELTMHFSFK